MQNGVLFRCVYFGSHKVPKLEQGLDCADRNGKTAALAKGRHILGTSVLGVQRVPKIERGLDRADRNGKAVTLAKWRHIPGTSIFGVHRAPEISQEGTSKAQLDTEQLDRREAEKEEAVIQDAVQIAEQEEARHEGELRQAWETRVVNGIKDRWQRLKQTGERRGTPEGQKEAAKERELRAKAKWGRVAAQVRVKGKEGRKRAA